MAGIGTNPASYDDGFDTVFQKDREDIFADAHTRQGIAYCLDRQSVVDNVLSGLTTVLVTYVPVEHPMYDPNIDPITFDTTTGISLLEQAGWRDTDGDPATPRLAVAVDTSKWKRLQSLIMTPPLLHNAGRRLRSFNARWRNAAWG